MAKKLYKITSAGKTALLDFPDTYDGIASEIGFEAASSSDVDTIPNLDSVDVAIKSGLIAQVSIGLENGKRKKVFVAIDKLGGISALKGKSFGTSPIKSASLRQFRKLR